MPRIQVSGSSKGAEFTPLPNGTYPLQIDSVEESTSKNEGSPQLRIKCHVVDGPHEGKSPMLFYSLKPKSLWKLKQLLDACGVEYNEDEVADSGDEDVDRQVEFDSDDLVGCTFLTDVRTETYNGKEQNRFEKERSPDETADNGKAAAAPAASKPATKPAAATQTSSAPRRTVRG